MWDLQQAIHVMDVGGVVLTVSEAREVSERLMCHLLQWQWLWQTYVRKGVKRWRLRPKHHSVQHQASFVGRTRLNLRFLSCFQDESYLGAVKHIAVRCHANSAVARTFQRLLLNLGQRFHDTRCQAEQS